MNLVEKARKIATIAHNGQYRWDKVTPYISHPQAVSCAVTGDYAKTVAWLHDVVEDTQVTLADLEKEGFPYQVIDAVRLLTRDKGENYLSYLLALKKDPIARQVKIADITHNLSDLDYEKNHNRYEKYVLARYLLTID